MTPTQREQFLEVIRNDRMIGNKTAAKRIGVVVTAKGIADEIASDPEFYADYCDARGRNHEEIRAAIRTRAIDGVEEPIYTPTGKLAGMRTVYSDRLLALMAKANLPEYRDRMAIEHTGSGGGPVVVQHERRLTLADVALFAGSLTGLGTSPRGELPAAREILAEPQQDQPPASNVSP